MPYVGLGNYYRFDELWAETRDLTCPTWFSRNGDV